jgi:hypothetical protein
MLVAAATPASSNSEPSAYNKTFMATFGARSLLFERTPGPELSTSRRTTTPGTTCRVPQTGCGDPYWVRTPACTLKPTL